MSRMTVTGRRVLFGNAASAALARLYARSYIAGRDGTVTTTRATGRTNPVTGALLGNNVPATTQISLGGLPLTMYGCWGQRQNIVVQSNGLGTPVTCTTARSIASPISAAGVLYTRTTTGQNYIFYGATAPITAQAYTGSFYAKRNNQDRVQVAVQDNDTPTRNMYACFDLALGTVVTTGQNGGTWTSITAKIAPVGSNGWFRCSITGTSNGAGVNAGMYLGSGTGIQPPAGSSNSNDTAYFDGFQIEAAAFPSPYIPTSGSAVTHNVEQNLWTWPWAFPSTWEATAFCVPYLWSAASGVAPPNSDQRPFSFASGSNEDAVYFQSARGFQFYNGASAVFPTRNAALASGTIIQINAGTTGTAAFLGLDNGTQGTAAVSAANVRTRATIGNNDGVSFPVFGFVGLVLTPGGLTASERAALNSLKPSSLAFAA